MIESGDPVFANSSVAETIEDVWNTLIGFWLYSCRVILIFTGEDLARSSLQVHWPLPVELEVLRDWNPVGNKKHSLVITRAVGHPVSEQQESLVSN
jgi:hypothetical protein